MSSCGCSVMSSSDRWPSGSTRRWAGSGGRVHRRPEGRARGSTCHRVPGAGGQPGMVLQVARGRRLTTTGATRAAGGRDPPAVRRASRPLRLPADHRRPARGGLAVSKNTVAKIMAEQRLVARSKRARRGGTRPGRGRWRAPDLIGRRFTAAQVNRKWYGDGTEIVTDEGKLYLDSVLDMASRRIVGFALGEHHDAALV